jgi:hypothetical protein
LTFNTIGNDRFILPNVRGHPHGIALIVGA